MISISHQGWLKLFKPWISSTKKKKQKWIPRLYLSFLYFINFPLVGVCVCVCFLQVTPWNMDLGTVPILQSATSNVHISLIDRIRTTTTVLGSNLSIYSLLHCIYEATYTLSLSHTHTHCINCTKDRRA